MNANVYTIQALTNLHVGSGEANVGVVDNLIQRDPATGLPAINASSLKGAFREHCTKNGMKEPVIKNIFGGAPQENERLQGTFRFFDGRLLAIPVRSDKAQFLMATCSAVLKEFKATFKMLNLNSPAGLPELPEITKPTVCNLNYANAYIEDLDSNTVLQNLSLNRLGELIGSDKLVLLPDNDFSTICNEQHLPVIARNYLENGISKNLWYEQVLPRYTVLYFPLLTPEGDLKKAFDQQLNTMVQIGANATVGYGFCNVKPL